MDDWWAAALVMLLVGAPLAALCALLALFDRHPLRSRRAQRRKGLR